MGRKNRRLPPGTYTYTLIYRSERQIGFFSDTDELYWNVTGNGWAFTIEKVRATVALPPGASVRQQAAYTGRFGHQGRDFNSHIDENGNPVFVTTRPLRPGEGLTIAVGITLFALPFFGGEIFGLILFTRAVTLSAALVFLLIIMTNVLFYHLIKAPTLRGRKIMDQIDGFCKFLSVAEKERLNMLNPPDKTPELFEKYLPYALSLDVENHWSEQFDDVLAASGDQDVYRPAWYSGTRFSSGNLSGFASGLGGAFAGAISAASQSPGSSSGSGGGGFSGGGGGGGGGGGW